jgi:hypothetical protein
MPLTKFYIPRNSRKNKYLYFIENNKVFLINIKQKRIRKSCYGLVEFKQKYTGPAIEANTPEEAIDIHMILGK